MSITMTLPDILIWNHTQGSTDLSKLLLACFIDVGVKICRNIYRANNEYLYMHRPHQYRTIRYSSTSNGLFIHVYIYLHFVLIHTYKRGCDSIYRYIES